MSKLICSSAIDGAMDWIVRAETKLDAAIKEKGENCKVGFPDTAYYLPVIYSFTGEKLKHWATCDPCCARPKNCWPRVRPTRCGCLIWEIRLIPV